VAEPEPDAPEDAALLLGEYFGVRVNAAVDPAVIHKAGKFLRHALQSTIGQAGK
jgi:hypothetical protein